MLPGFDAHGDVDAETARRVARAWLNGGIVGLPTETVYGLAADAQDAEAVARVYQVKGRPADHPLIVHVSGPAALEGWSARPNRVAQLLAEAFWPGPLTVIVERGPRAGDFITGGQETVALRCPDHPVAGACIEALGNAASDPARGVAAPSANRFGRVSSTRAQDVVDEVGDRLDPTRDLVVDGGPCAVGIESAIVDCTADPPRVLRPGAISQAQIDALLAAERLGAAAEPLAGAAETGGWAEGAGGGEGEAAESGGSAEGAGGGEAAATAVRAPGTLEAHYAPVARVVLVEPQDALGPADLRTARGTGSAGPVGLLAVARVETPPGWVRLAAPSTIEQYARDLYTALRRADQSAIAVVLVVLPEESGDPLAVALRDRLARASHGR